MSNFQVDLRDKVALVTGAGAGNGEAIALALAKAGAHVGMNDINPDRLAKIEAQVQAEGVQTASFAGDITNRFQAATFIESSRDVLGSRIDILVNAVGIYKAQPFYKVDEWDWRRQIEIHIIGTFFMTQLVGRVMMDEGGGNIVNIASTASHPNPLTEGVGYVTGKAGIIGMSKQAAREFAPHGIRVNTVCPAHIREDDMPHNEQPSNALSTMGEPNDIANVTLFLVSDAARFITGQAINVDGGESML
jgi:3-oxoacyl-[acyl-carrier protein] reductase